MRYILVLFAGRQMKLCGTGQPSNTSTVLFYDSTVRLRPYLVRFYFFRERANGIMKDNITYPLFAVSGFKEDAMLAILYCVAVLY